jgi:hypothetical protein
MRALVLQYKTICLFIACIIIYFTMVLAMQLPSIYTNSGYVQSDAESYVGAAKNLYLDATLHADRPIGIAAYIGLPLLFDSAFTSFYLWAWCANTVLWFGILLLFFLSAKQFLPFQFASIATLFLAIHVSGIVYTSLAISEIPFLFVLMAALYTFSLFYTTRQLHYLIFTTFFIWLSVSFRPGMVIGFYITSLALLYFFIKQNYITGIVFIISCHLILHLYCVQIQKQFGSYTVSVIGKSTLDNYLAIRAKQLQNHTNYIQEIQKKDKSTSGFAHQLSHSPHTLFAAFFWNVFDNCTKGNPCLQANRSDNSKPWLTSLHRVFHFISLLQNIICSLVGIFGFLFLYKYKKKLYRKYFVFLQILLCISIYIIGISGISFYQHDRFHFVIAPIIYLFIASVIYQYRNLNEATPSVRLAP